MPRLAAHAGPRFLQIGGALQAAMADASLRAGDRLPPQRLLAAQLDVDLSTVTCACAYWNASQLAHAAGSEGIAVTPAEAFATGGAAVNAIWISLGSIKERGRLQAGLQRLSQLLARRPEPFGTAVV